MFSVFIKSLLSMVLHSYVVVMDPCLLMTCILPEPKCIPVFLTMIHAARDLDRHPIKTSEGFNKQDNWIFTIGNENTFTFSFTITLNTATW